ncbi:MBL fold metallo-hydrolase [Nanoarchaeota archaeon]
MKLIFHGGAGEVGRSCIEISTPQKRILLDCGLKLTPEGTEFPLGFDSVNDIDAVFISHAHLDHTGALPLLDHKGMDCPIFATKTTKAITRLLLKDAFKIGKINHAHLEYDELDIKKVLNCMQRVKIDQKGTFKDIDYKFFGAGHIPGAASVYLNVEGKRFLYTGDINDSETQLHHAAETDFPEIDVMICESTYGDRDHPPRRKVEDGFIEEIEKTIAEGGSVIIPVFAIGRSQEILLLLATHKFKVPIYFDGMGVAATDLMLQNPESVKDGRLLNAALKKVKLIRSRGDRMEAIKRQSIILTTSGMLTGGPILHYLKYMHDNPKHAVLVTGYQAEETNGRLLLEQGDIFIDGHKRKVNCKVKQFDFSAHAGMSELKELVRKANPKKVIFLHGEERSVMNLKQWADALGMAAYAPKLGDVIEL